VSSGMTLLELLIVIAIVGLLASLVSPAVSKQMERATAQQELLDLRNRFRSLSFRAYSTGVPIEVRASGSSLEWRSADISRVKTYKHLFFDPLQELTISSSGIASVQNLSFRQRAAPRQLPLNEWISEEPEP
jgi:prepilin-type N-terminal cleavage/methylation domain-containing protein